MGNKEAVNERLAIRNARLVSALTEGYDGDQADLLIEDGRITGLFPVGHDFGSCDEIDAAGRSCQGCLTCTRTCILPKWMTWF